MKASIVCGTFGTSGWIAIAETRALPTAEGQGAEVIHVHGRTLAEARNEAIAKASGEWIVVLDADDELAPGYGEAILEGAGDLRTPSVQFVYPEIEQPPKLIPPRDLRRGNYLVIGTAFPKALFEKVGGFHEYGLYEDWDFFLRCWLAGAQIGQVSQAVYRAFMRLNSRNNPTRAEQVRARNLIYRKHARIKREAAWNR